MSAETELYAVLSGAAGLTALVGNRIYPDAIPEDAALPAVVYARASTEPVLSVSGQKFAETARLTISAWAKTRTAAAAAGDQIEAALLAAWQPALNRSSVFDGEVGLYAATVESDWFTVS